MIIVECNMFRIMDSLYLLTGVVSGTVYASLSLLGDVDLNDRLLQTGFGAVVLVQLGLIAWLIQKYINEQRSLYEILIEHAKILERLTERIEKLHETQRDMMNRMKCYSCTRENEGRRDE